HLVNNYARFIKVTPQDRMTLFAPFGHSAGVMDIYGALLYGATLLPYDVYTNGIETIKEWLVRERVTVYHSVPTLFRTMIDMLEGSENFPDLRVLDLGGETVYLKDVNAYKKHFSDNCIFTNGFGSTELTVLFQFKADKKFASKETVFPIGNPVPGVEYLILDGEGNEVEDNSIGELVYTSPALTPGYWKLPELNRAIFRILPNHPGKRWIFSGDLVNRNKDGTLTFVERKDFQVKVRGFRVELAEIEHSLETHPMVKQAVVVDRGTQSSGSSLTAFIVTRTQEFPSHAELREYLGRFLPDYMLPESYLALPNLPYTASGKIDRNSLINRELPKSPQKPPAREPHPGLEEKLLNIWKSVLGIEHVYVNSGFFELGGNSLTALRLAYQVRKDLGIELPLDAIFQTPTIELQAKLLSQEGQDSSWKTLIPVKPNGSKIPFFCVSPTVIDVITYKDLADQLDQEQPLYALYSQKGGTFREINEPISEQINKFIEEIRQVQAKGPYHIGGYSAGGRAALQIAYQLKVEGELVTSVILLDTFGPGYPERLPWVTPKLFNLLKILRRVESYLWKFWILDWSGKRDLLLSRERPLVSRVSNWIENRTGEFKKVQKRRSNPAQMDTTFSFDEINVNVVLLRAKRGLLGVKKDRSLGWFKIFGRKLTVQEVPGDHEAILFGPRIRKVGHLIQEYLNKAIEEN
ncbi:MAG: AMP-binding protein, partial [Anaerolineaceae bacterium]|nr:AMP-binding protein [Anaerolineaceae bacterium]